MASSNIFNRNIQHSNLTSIITIKLSIKKTTKFTNPIISNILLQYKYIFTYTYKLKIPRHNWIRNPYSTFWCMHSISVIFCKVTFHMYKVHASKTSANDQRKRKIIAKKRYYKEPLVSQTNSQVHCACHMVQATSPFGWTFQEFLD